MHITGPIRTAMLAATLALAVTACGSSASRGLIDPTPTGSSASASGGEGTWLVSRCSEIAAPTQASGPVGTQVSAGLAVEQAAPADAPTVSVAAGTPPATELAGYDLIPGDGATVAEGATVTGNYCGVGLASGAIFDSSWARGQEATFPLSGVIAGWTQGLPGMKVGGTRVLVIPGSLAYKDNPPQGSGIAPNETLIFVVSLTATQ